MSPYTRTIANRQKGESVCTDSVFTFFRHVQTPNLLLLDCCEPHTGESIVAEFSSHHSNRLIIPGGCTSKLQPLDISLKNIFHVSEYIPYSLPQCLISQFNVVQSLNL
jgi:hypothetical protein